MKTKKGGNEVTGSNASHTPTPWQIENESIDKEGRQGIRIGNPKLGIVFDMVYTGHYAADNPEAHAAFIVRAVNSHESMLTLLKQVRIQFEAEAKIVKGAAKKWNLFLEELNTVIAQAEERP